MTTTLVTGANKGLGYETARQLIALGHTVYVGGREERRIREAAERLGGVPLLVDVTDDASVKAAADEVRAAGRGLDVLVNNAGIAGGAANPSETTAADIARILDTNVVGVVRMMSAFLPLLDESPYGVVVNVGSGLGSLGRMTDPDSPHSRWALLSYPTSKAALNMLTVQYAKAYPRLRVNVVDPGYTATDLNNFTGIQTVEQGVVPIVAAATLTGPDAPTGRFLDANGPVPW
jgi:NAD(P)-dependent dehydrogenase (short-subunit alcohol dehydrogenase family)